MADSITLTCLHIHPSDPASTFPITVPSASPISHLRSLIAFHLNASPSLIKLHAVQMFLSPQDPSVGAAKRGDADSVLGTKELKNAEMEVADIKVWGKGGVDVVVKMDEELPGYKMAAMDGSSAMGDGTLFGGDGIKQNVYISQNNGMGSSESPMFIQSVNSGPTESILPVPNRPQIYNTPRAEPLPPKNAEPGARRKWIMIIVGIVFLMLVLAAGIGVGVAVGKKGNNESPPPNQTTTNAPKPTTSASPGGILKSYSLFQMIATSVNPASNDTFYASEESSDHGFNEISIATGDVVKIFKGPHKTDVFGITATNDKIVSADSSTIATWDHSGALINTFAVPTTSPSTFSVRFMGTSNFPNTQDWSLVVLNNYYATQSNRSGYILMAPVSNNSYFPFSYNNIVPWCGVMLAPGSDVLVGTSDGSVVRYLYSFQAGGWTRAGSFRAHRGDVRWMVAGGTSRILYTGGFDGFVRAWDVDNLPSSGSGNDLADPLLTYSGFVGQIYCVALSADEAVMVAGDSQGMVQAFTKSTSTGLPSQTKTWANNVNFPVYQIQYLAASNSWLVAGGTSNPVRLSN
ncbi:hypothetical protein HDU97_005628 [Phlyctochytrium planicorne]|nr:hypothetical protein HDU97_005628 [Phlyctochytrium planicorne]